MILIQVIYRFSPALKRDYEAQMVGLIVCVSFVGIFSARDNRHNIPVEQNSKRFGSELAECLTQLMGIYG